MKLFDTLYYAIYRFGRKIGQPHLQAKACAGNVMPYFFICAIFGTYCALALKFRPQMLPPKSFKPIFIGLVVIILIMSYLLYGGRNGRGNLIISKFEKLKNQRFYAVLGAVVATLAILSPGLLFFVLRAVA